MLTDAYFDHIEDRCKSNDDACSDDMYDLSGECRDLIAEIEALRDALRPFVSSWRLCSIGSIDNTWDVRVSKEHRDVAAAIVFPAPQA